MYIYYVRDFRTAFCYHENNNFLLILVKDGCKKINL